MENSDETQGNRRMGFWRRLGRWFARRFGDRSGGTGTVNGTASSAGAAVAPVPPLSESADAGDPLRIPAQGEVFDFHVRVEATWTAEVPSLADLRERTGRHAESVRRAVRDRIWAVGRDHLPHRAGAAESAMTATLPPEFCFDDSGTLLRCQARLRVRPDPRVLAHLLPYWKRYLSMDAEHMLGELRLGQTEGLAVRWRQVLNDQFGGALGELVLPFAARLTGDLEFAKVMKGLDEERHRARVRLAEVLDQAAKGHSRVGLFEFAETALAAFRRDQGLPDPLPSPGGGT
jgi:hypothetical protein